MNEVVIQVTTANNSFTRVEALLNQLFPAGGYTIRAGGNGMQVVRNLDDQQVEALQNRLRRFTTMYVREINGRDMTR